MATNVTVNAGEGSTQVTVITGEGSTSYKVEAGSRGPAGTNGTNGTNGAAGPNSVTTSTSSNLTGFIAADGTNVSGATAGATAATANTLALRDATGGSNFAAVGATSVTSSGVISTTGATATISTSGVNGSISTSGVDAFIATNGVNAFIATGGTTATIFTYGADAHIYTNGANAYIQSRSTFKLYNGTNTTTLSHSPTADRAIAFPNKDGTLAMVDAETHTGAHAFSSTTRPTSAGTGTPAATSLITRDDGDTRYGQQLFVSQSTAETSAANTTTYVSSTQCTLALAVGTYRVEAWIQVEGLGSTGSAKGQLNFTGTATGSSIVFLAGGSPTIYLQNAVPGLAQNGSRVFNSSVAFNYSSNRGGVMHLRFNLTVTAAGTLAIQYAPAVAVALQTAEISVGSFISARKIA